MIAVCFSACLWIVIVIVNDLTAIPFWWQSSVSHLKCERTRGRRKRPAASRRTVRHLSQHNCGEESRKTEATFELTFRRERWMSETVTGLRLVQLFASSHHAALSSNDGSSRCCVAFKRTWHLRHGRVLHFKCWVLFLKVTVLLLDDGGLSACSCALIRPFMGKWNT